MTSSGWPPNDPGQNKPGPYNPGQHNPTQYNPGPYNPGQYEPNQHNPTQYNPGPWSPPPMSTPPLSNPPEPTSYLPGGFGQPGAYSPPNAYRGAPTRAPGLAGMVVAAVGAALAVLGLFLDWYANGTASAGVKALVRASKLDGAPGLAHLYFGWALWVVLAIAIAVAISANLAGSAVAPLAIGGAVAGVVSTGLTYAALNSGRTSGSPFDHAAIGLWLFLLGPLILAAGALFALARPSR